MKRETFDLGEVHGGWHGLLLAELRVPLELGLAAARERLAAVDFAVVVLVSDFGLDGLLEHVDALEAAATLGAAERAARSAHDAAVARFLDAHPDWRVDPMPASPHPSWAAAAPHFAGSRLIGSYVDSAYVRAWIHERAGEGNVLDTLLAQWPREMQSEIVSWLLGEGSDCKSVPGSELTS